MKVLWRKLFGECKKYTFDVSVCTRQNATNPTCGCTEMGDGPLFSTTQLRIHTVFEYLFEIHKTMLSWKKLFIKRIPMCMCSTMSIAETIEAKQFMLHAKLLFKSFEFSFCSVLFSSFQFYYQSLSFLVRPFIFFTPFIWFAKNSFLYHILSTHSGHPLILLSKCCTNIMFHFT